MPCYSHSTITALPPLTDARTAAFCIGVPTHWVVAVVVKVGGEVEVTLVDSINHVLVGASKATLWDHVQNYVAFRWYAGAV